MKAVLISIQPQWCELIAAGKKILEVRKTRPKLETPFKCYIYCTLSGSNEFFKDALNGDVAEWNRGKRGERKGNVIGEFICDTFVTDMTFGHDPLFNAAACMSEIQAVSYMTDSPAFGWHISNLKIYDKPKEIREFYFPEEKYCEHGLCGGCPYEEPTGEYGDVMFDCEWKRPLSRPPQSWCYVEEVD